MPKTLLEKNGYRLYVRGPKDDSRYFVSHFNGTLFRRIELHHIGANTLLNDTEDAFEEQAENVLTAAKSVGHKQYHETVTGGPT